MVARRSSVALACVLAVALAGCGDGGAADDGAGPDGGPRVLVTTAILGDVVADVLADTGAEVEVLMPSGVDPHAYEPSAADGLALREADLVVANGLGLEESLLDVLDAAADDGALVVEVAEQVDPLTVAGDGEHAAADDGHADEDEEHAGEDDGHADEDDEDDHADEGDHGGLDPHVWLDPVRVGEVARVVADAYAEVDPEAAATVEANAADVAATMDALDDELQELVATLPSERRRVVSNHEALGYLAARYDLDVVATVLPGTSTDVDVTAAAFTELVGTIREAEVPAIFADTSSSDRLAQSLASELGDVEVVELFTESLGEPGSGADTVAGMIRTNVERIVEALG